MSKLNRSKFKKIIDDTHRIPDRNGNGILRFTMSIDEKGNLAHYSMAYINYRICDLDNGRVIGYDNSHGYHHRHDMGKEKPVDFENYEKIAEKFDKEWREIHEKAKRKSYH